MLLEIPENSNRTLLDQAKIQLTIKAMEIYCNQKDAANHIGISIRGLRNWIAKFKELKKYKRTSSPYWEEDESWGKKSDKSMCNSISDANNLGVLKHTNNKN